MRRMLAKAGPTAVLLTTMLLGLHAQPPDRTYTAYVASEAADKLTRIEFGASGARVVREIAVGIMPTDIDGPHGLATAPDQKSYYVSFAHGTPFGTVWRYATGTDAPLGKVTLGNFPATMDLTPDGEFLYVVNFNLHGDMVPSSVSVVSTEDMLEIARIDTCTMPHGSRINAAGTRHYSACMMDDQLVEIDTQRLKASRHFMLTRGQEAGMTGPPMKSDAAHRQHGAGGHGTEAPVPGDTSCSPTWAQPSRDGRSVYVACNGSSDIVEIDTDGWSLRRRIPAGPGAYNLAITRNNRLLVTNRRDASVSVIDLTDGQELARVTTKRKVVHGVVVTDDDRYAFVSVEGIGGEPGTVEILDLRTLRMAASVDVPPQAGGIDLLRP